MFENKLADVFVRLTLPLTCGTRGHDTTEREGHARAGPGAVRCSGVLARAPGPNPEPRFIENPQPSLNSFGRQQAGKGYGNPTDARQGLVAQTKHNDARRRGRRMLNDIAEAAIERHQHAAFACRDREEPIIGNTGQLFVTSKCHIMASLTESRPNRVGNVLIELDRRHDYAAGIGTMVSRASSAA